MYDQIYSLPSAIVEIILSTNFGTTPLRKSNAALIYTRKLSDVNSFLVTFFTQKQNLPTNYFLNPTDNNRPALRPTELDTYSLALGYERIFSDRFKSKLEISAGQRIQDRPKRYGAELKALYVVSDNKAIRADVGYLVESQVENLNTDLGYQDSKWFESKYIHTINSYVTYGIGYGTEINRESRVWQNSIEQLGNDQALFDLTYDDSKWSLSLAGAYAQYNTGQVGSNLKLEFSWDL